MGHIDTLECAKWLINVDKVGKNEFLLNSYARRFLDAEVKCCIEVLNLDIKLDHAK